LRTQTLETKAALFLVFWLLRWLLRSWLLRLLIQGMRTGDSEEGVSADMGEGVVAGVPYTVKDQESRDIE
jgi:hypothetical protein